MCVCVCFVGQVQMSGFSPLGKMKHDKQRNYTALWGGIKAEDRDTEEQLRIENRTGENLRDKVLTVGAFESV